MENIKRSVNDRYYAFSILTGQLEGEGQGHHAWVDAGQHAEGELHAEEILVTVMLLAVVDSCLVGRLTFVAGSLKLGMHSKLCEASSRQSNRR